MYSKHMNAHSMTWKVILLTVVYCVSCMCPPPTMNTSFATQKCSNDPRSYHCLWDGLNDKFIEICVSPEYYTPGSYVVFQKALNAKRCPASRYQPFAYWTNAENRCIYQKSNCNAEGQHLLSGSGTTTTDITCRCDYRKGYSYLIRPEDPCNCKPNEEDCSCYLKFCNDDQALSPDYNCEVIKSDVIRQYQCPRLVKSSADNTDHRNRTNVQLTSNSYNIIRQPIDRFLVGRVLLGAIVVMIATFSVWFGVLVFADEEKSDLSQLIDTSTVQCVTDTDAFKKAKIAFENNSILIIKGEHGSGKTSLAMQLSTMYRTNNYTVIVLDNTNVHLLNSIKNSFVKYVIVLEDWFDACAKEKKWPQSIINSLKNIQMSSKSKAIVTVKSATYTDCEKLKSAGIWTESNIVNLDLDDSFSKKDREKILLFHLDFNKRNLDEIEIKKIIIEQTVGAFPIHCAAFCTTNIYFELGSRFFRLPQRGLVDKINELRSKGMKNITDRIKYCTLVYILINPDNGLQLNHIDTKKINGICRYVFKQKCSEESLIKTACQSMRLVYLKCNESGDYFLRPVIYQAVLLSHAYIDFECLKLVLQNCDLEAIIDVLRPPTYVKLNEEESVLIVDKNKLDGFNIIAKRFAEACLQNEQLSELICKYLESYKFSTVLQKTISNLDNHLKNLTTENRVKLMILLTKRLTSNCSSLELINYTPTDFALAWSIIVFQISNKTKLLSEIDKAFLSKGNHRSLEGILKTVVDEHGNTILHYCILWWDNRENPLIMRISKTLRLSASNYINLSGKTSILIRNKDVSMSALDFAAYFGNYEAVSILVNIAKWDKIGPKDISILIEFAENGKANNSIQNYGSCEFVNNDVCGSISVNEQFSYDKTIEQLQSILKDIT